MSTRRKRCSIALSRPVGGVGSLSVQYKLTDAGARRPPLGDRHAASSPNAEAKDSPPSGWLGPSVPWRPTRHRATRRSRHRASSSLPRVLWRLENAKTSRFGPLSATARTTENATHAHRTAVLGTSAHPVHRLYSTPSRKTLLQLGRAWCNVALVHQTERPPANPAFKRTLEAAARSAGAVQRRLMQR